MNRYRNCMKIIRKFAVVQKFEWRDSRDKYELVTNVEAARDGTVSSAPRQHCVAFGNVAAPQRGGREADLCTGQGGRGRWVQPRPQKDFQVGGPCQPWILAEVPGSFVHSLGIRRRRSRGGRAAAEVRGLRGGEEQQGQGSQSIPEPRTGEELWQPRGSSCFFYNGLVKMSFPGLVDLS